MYLALQTAGSTGAASDRTDPPERSGALFVLRVPDATGTQQARGYDARVEATSVTRVLLASPRGYCAGVERAVETVELALAHYGAPIYVRKQIVHNAHVVRDLEARGAVFVDDESEVPEGATIVYSAHGVAPSVHDRSGELRHNVIDATCPLVTKVHVQASATPRGLHGHPHRPCRPRGGRRDDGRGAGVHDPRRVGRRRRPPDFAPGTRLAYITQTTLSVDETARGHRGAARRFPDIQAPKKEDICYATSNRQWAVKELLGRSTSCS